MSSETTFSLSNTIPFYEAAAEMEGFPGWPQTKLESRQKLMKCIRRGIYDGPIWHLEPTLHTVEAQDVKDAVQYDPNDLLEGEFGLLLHSYCEPPVIGGNASRQVEPWLEAMRLDFECFVSFKNGWLEQGRDKSSQENKLHPGSTHEAIEIIRQKFSAQKPALWPVLKGIAQKYPDRPPFQLTKLEVREEVEGFAKISISSRTFDRAWTLLKQVYGQAG